MTNDPMRPKWTYEEAVAFLEGFTAGIENHDDDWQPSPEDQLEALARRDRLEAIKPAWAFAIVWRHDIGKPEFVMPSFRLVGMVEYLINDPVWTKRYYNEDGSLIEE